MPPQNASLHALPPNIALAKIQPPRPRAGLVARPALERALGAALDHSRLVLLVAPAGYGKTAALTRQIRRLPEGTALAWVSADDDDPLQRFLACLTAALEPHDLPWRVAPDALATLTLAERGLRDAAGELVNALASAEVDRGLIVIDDAHRIADPRVFEFLQLVLDRLPAQWTLVIASRVEPPLALARLRGSGELAEFRQHELRFGEGEVIAMLAAVNAGNPGATSAAARQAEARSAHDLLLRTGGWAAGLRLSLAARPGAPAAGTSDATQRHLFDYLASEVLAGMPGELRDFLLRCSVLPELTAARCAHVSGQPQAARLLDEIERRGLFVSVLDADEFTLKLHDLFRGFLEDRLAREHAGELPALLRRAAQHETELARAVSYLVRAGAWDEATALLAQRAPEQISIGAHATLIQLLALFPEAEFARRPDLHMVRGLAAWPRFDWDTLLVSMQHAAEGYTRAGRLREAALTRVNACSGLHHAGRPEDASRELARLRELNLDDAARAFVLFTSAWNEFAAARTEHVAPFYAQMLATLERVPAPLLWQQFSIHFVFVGLPGMQPLLARFAHGAMRVGGDSPTQLRAGMMHLRCWLALSQGRLAEAWQWLGRADDDCRWLGTPRPVITENRTARALLHALRGEAAASHAAAQDMVDDIEQHSPLAHRRVHACEVLFLHSRAAWILQDADVLRRLDAAMARAANPFEWAAAPQNRRLCRAFVALLEERLDDAQALLEPLAADIDRSLFFPAVTARVLLADVQQRRGDVAAAAATLQPWLAEAAETGEVGGALLAGLEVAGRLASADWAGRLTAAELGVLDGVYAVLRQARNGNLEAATAMAGEAQHAPAFVTPAFEPLMPVSDSRPAPLHDRRATDVARLAPENRGDLASLTERERDVLARMAEGDSNKLIARAFDLSPHTVKRHVANILGKLGVETRGQAAARWRGQ
ncbi:hypothetical protein BH11PSE9_BH11PSE9_16190 [soil metagenome]